MEKYSFDDIKNMDAKYVMPTYARSSVAFEYGKNATLYSTSGEDYIDFTSGIGVCGIGHGNEKLADALYIQAKNLLHTSNVFYIRNQALLAKKIVELCGFGKEYKIFFGNSGAEANECAIKIARKYGESTNRFGIITLDSSFHGRTIATLKATGQDKFHKHFSPFPDGFVRAKNIKDIYTKSDKNTIAILIELIQGEGGVKEQDMTEVKELAKFCKQKDILLMVDEVQSGIYRSGEIFVSKIYGIEPDVITMAKSLGGGVPIGACMSAVDVFGNGDHGSTFGGNPLSCMAGITTLDILSSIHKSGVLAKTIKIFNTRLESICKSYPKVFLRKNGIGLMCGLEVSSEDKLSYIISHALEKRVLLLKAGKNTLRFLPPLSISEEEIALGFERVEKVLENI